MVHKFALTFLLKFNHIQQSDYLFENVALNTFYKLLNNLFLFLKFSKFYMIIMGYLEEYTY